MSLPASPPCTYCGSETSPHGEEFRYLTDGVWHHRSCHPPDRYKPTVPSEALGRTLGPITMDWQRAAIEARAYGHREPIPETSAASPAVESPPGEPGASSATSRSAVGTAIPELPSAEPTPDGVSAGPAEVATSATGSEAGVVPAAPPQDAPGRRDGPDPATPAAAGPGESPAADHRCDWCGAMGATVGYPGDEWYHPACAGEEFLRSTDHLSSAPPGRGDPRPPGGVGDSFTSPDPAEAPPPVGPAGSGDLAAWDRALELGDLEQLLGRLRALAEAVDDPGNVVSGRTMAGLIRMAVGGERG